jgi:hypothetical protein
MWTRPAVVLFARMPSMRPQSGAPAVKPSARRAAARPLPAESAPEDDGALTPRDGGFHESSYELRTGMDMLETEWPDDTTMPGALDELPPARPPRR